MKSTPDAAPQRRSVRDESAGPASDEAHGPLAMHRKEPAPPSLAPHGDGAMAAFARTANAADLWAAAARANPQQRTLGLASAVVATFEVAVEHFDREFLGWLGSIRLPDQVAGPDGSEVVLPWSDAERDALRELKHAQAAWETARLASPRDGLLATVAAAAGVLVRTVATADAAALMRVWTWAYGAPVHEAHPLVGQQRGRWARSENDALRTLQHAAELLADEARRQPMSPQAGLVAAVVAGVANAIGREDRTALAALRETLLDPTPVRQVLSARGLPTSVAQRDDLEGDSALRSTLAASDAWRRAVEAPWASRTTRLAAPIFVALAEATIRGDMDALGEFEGWAHRYIENKRVMPTHERSVRASAAVTRLLADLRSYEQREAAEEGSPRARWSAFVSDAVESITALFPECLAGRVAPGDIVDRMRARLEASSERERLLGIRYREPSVPADTGEEAFARAVAVSALKAIEHTADLAENLFAYQRVARNRKGVD